MERAPLIVPNVYVVVFPSRRRQGAAIDHSSSIRELTETVFGPALSDLRPLTLFPPPRGKIGETFDFAPGKILTEANNLGRIVVVSPNAETVSGRFSGNPSASVMTPPLRSPTMPAEPKTIRHCVRVFRRGMQSRTFLPTDHATAPSLQHAHNCKMPLCMSSTRAIRVQRSRSSFSSSVVTNRVSWWPSS